MAKRLSDTGAAVAILAASCLAGGNSAAQNTELGQLLAAPIAIERSVPVTSVPLDVRMGKLFLDATVNGQTREFIFDTGSPSILSREFADALGLETVGQNSGVDANGNAVTMDFAILDLVMIGETRFHDVPVLILDYATLEMGTCFVDGGVLGSELLPGSAWQIDSENQVLRIAADAAELHGTAPFVRARLYDFGYPHAPVIDYSVGDVTDKALFDTGSSAELSLFQRLAETRSVRQAIIPGSVTTGHGSEGVSAGGRGDDTELVRFSVAGLRLDGQPAGTLRGVTRTQPPTLIGAGILASHVVTLDYPGAAFLLHTRSAPAPQRPEAGYQIAYLGDEARIVQLFDDSPAARAGLRLNDQVVEVQGRPLTVTPENSCCETGRWLAERFDGSLATDLIVQRDGSPVTLRIAGAPALSD